VSPSNMSNVCRTCILCRAVTGRITKVLVGVSIAASASVGAAAIFSFWRSVGWSWTEHAWVPVPGSGMTELHRTNRIVHLHRGRFEAIETESLSAVIPIGSSAATEIAPESAWLWRPATPDRERTWDERWHLTRLNEWRMGDIGWYESAGGGAVSHVVSVPLWLVAAVLGVPWELRVLAAAKARRRLRSGRCPTCGYDRRRMDAAAPCPECGACGASGERAKD